MLIYLVSLHPSRVSFDDLEAHSLKAHGFMAHGMWVPGMTLWETLGSGEKSTLLVSLSCDHIPDPSQTDQLYDLG